jgi:hypothetical protein
MIYLMMQCGKPMAKKGQFAKSSDKVKKVGI